MAESRLSIVIESRSAEQQAQDLRRALQAVENAGVRVTSSANSVTQQFRQEGQAASQLGGQLDSARGSAQRMDQAQQKLAQGQKGVFQSVNNTASQADNLAQKYNAAGLSAKQLQMAQRQLPMQFTDIFTSLAAGQPPIQVLLQQGGQLKDVFGGIGPAFRESARYILRLVNPVTVLAGALVGLYAAYESGAGESRRFQESLSLTGNIAGTTSQQLSQFAESLDGIAGATTHEAADALDQVVRSGEFAESQISNVAATAITLRQTIGRSIEDTISDFSDLSDDPVKSIQSLNEQYNFLTADMYEQINALQREGNQTEATERAMDAYSEAMRNRSRAVTQNLGDIEKAWNAVKNVTREAIDEMQSIGRGPNLEGYIQQLRDELGASGIRNTNLGVNTPTAPNRRGEAEREIQFYEDMAAAISAFAPASREYQKEQNRQIEHDQRINDLIDARHTTQYQINQQLKERNQLQEELASTDDPERRSEIQDSIRARNQQISSLRENTEAQQRAEQAQREFRQQVEQSRRAVQGLFGDYNEAGRALADYYDRLDSINQSGAFRINPELERSAAIGANAMRLAQDSAEEGGRNRIAALRQQQEALLNERRRAYSMEIAGVGMGDDQLQRAQDIQKIRQQYLDRQSDVVSQFSQGDISEEQKDQQLALLKEYSKEAVSIRRDMYDQMDAARGDWQNGFNSALDDFLRQSQNVAGQFESAFGNAFSSANDELAKFLTGAEADLGGFLQSVAQDFAKIGIRQAESSLLSSIGFSAATGASSYAGGDFTSAIGLASGGPVSGPGTSTSDSIPARLSDGEYVVNAAATKRHRPVLDAINSGQGKSFDSGGPASSGSGGKTEFNFSPTIQMQYQPGANDSDVRRQAQQSTDEMKAQFQQWLLDEKENGGLLS
ncbi:lambda family phage tail tape measure protein [Kushneria sinocarnis]|uniref:Lambda family phage tail tape measure protein n=1 Tax=Kushneria sinocarnis TaxID=595502 RepID=A0A420WUN1_9GAMM|nr:phage tail tape measure protein [Kushneria sinocarnis]RKQ97156.1 lambda family phage tail tape measure protein [Kushneria sinocarnis]